MKAHVNLLVADLFGEERFPFQKVALPGTFLFLLAAILVGTMVEFQRARSLNQKLTALNGQRADIIQSISSLQAETAEILRQEDQAIEVNRARAVLLKRLEQERIHWSGLVQEMSHLVPEGVWLTLLESLEKRELRIVGFAQSHEGIARLVSELERSRYFQEIRLVYAEKKIEMGQTHVTFEVRSFIR